MSHDRHPAAACERLLDALALELLEADDDDVGPLHGGQSLKAAADQVRMRILQAVQRSTPARDCAPPSLPDDPSPNARRRR